MDKRRYSLNLIFARLTNTGKIEAAMNVLCLNVAHVLRVLLRLFILRLGLVGFSRSPRNSVVSQHTLNRIIRRTLVFLTVTSSLLAAACSPNAVNQTGDRNQSSTPLLTDKPAMSGGEEVSTDPGEQPDISETGEYEDDQKTIEINIFKEALSAYNDLDFESALALLRTLPDGYEDTGLYIESISAVNDLMSGKWLEAAEKFTLLNNRRDEITSGYNSLMHPLTQMMIDNFGALPGISINEFHGLSDLCILFYYEENMQLGNDITQLAEYPYDPSSITFENVICDRRIQRLKASLREQGLYEYFSSGGAFISPVDVTGNGIYIIIDPTQIMHHISRIYLEHEKIAPWCLADKPEEVRFVLAVIDTFSYFGTYDNGTKGYSTETHVTLTDVVTGEYLFNNYYRADPPTTTARTERDNYGMINLTAAIKEEILPILALHGLTVYS